MVRLNQRGMVQDEVGKKAGARSCGTYRPGEGSLDLFKHSRKHLEVLSREVSLGRFLKKDLERNKRLMWFSAAAVQVRKWWIGLGQ